MRCENVRLYLDAYHDGELSRWRTRQVQKHLQRCPGCAGEREALQHLDTLLRAADVVENTASIPPLVVPAPSPDFGVVYRRRPRWLPVVAVPLVFSSAYLGYAALHPRSDVVTVHTRGILTWYGDQDKKGQVIPRVLRTETWFKSPDWWRSEESWVHKPNGSSYIPHLTVRHGDTGVQVAADGSDPTVQDVTLHRFWTDRLFGWLRPAPYSHFAVPSGAQPSTLNGRPVQEYHQNLVMDDYRSSSLTDYDPKTGRPVYSRTEMYKKSGSVWRPVMTQENTEYVYNQPLPDSLFEMPPHPLSATH